MCDCIEAVDKQLKEAGHNTRVKMPLLMFSGTAAPRVVTEKVDSKKRGKPIALFCSYCPFCGEKYA